MKIERAVRIGASALDRIRHRVRPASNVPRRPPGRIGFDGGGITESIAVVDVSPIVYYVMYNMGDECYGNAHGQIG